MPAGCSRLGRVLIDFIELVALSTPNVSKHLVQFFTLYKLGTGEASRVR